MVLFEFYIFLVVVGVWWYSCNAGGGRCSVKMVCNSTKMYNSCLVTNCNSHFSLSLSYFDVSLEVTRLSSKRIDLKNQLILSYKCRMDTGTSIRLDVWKTSMLWCTSHLSWSQSTSKILYFHALGYGNIRLYIKYKLLK